MRFCSKEHRWSVHSAWKQNSGPLILTPLLFEYLVVLWTNSFMVFILPIRKSWLSCNIWDNWFYIEVKKKAHNILCWDAETQASAICQHQFTQLISWPFPVYLHSKSLTNVTSSNPHKWLYPIIVLTLLMT